MHLLITFLLGLCLICFQQPAGADELDDLLSGFGDGKTATTDEIDELLSGFGDEQDTTPPTEDGRRSELPGWLDLSGSLSLRSAVNFAHDAPPPETPDYRGLSMFRALGEVIADVTSGDWRGRISGTAFFDAATYLNDQRERYTDDYLNEYGQEIELGETWIQGSLSENLDIKFGRQIVVWGKSDTLRVTDVLNPLDLRWPGMTDIRYLRLPTTKTKLDYYISDWSASVIIVNEPRFAKTPVYNGEFFPGNSPLPDLQEPGWSWQNQQPALAINGIFSGWDISFYGGWIYPQNGYVDQDLSGTPYRTYDQALMVGTAVNVALGNWLLKAEAAGWSGLEYTAIEDEKARFDVLGGIEYSGFTETSITVEIANRHIFDYDPLLAGQPDAVEEDTTQYALRLTRDFVNDTLHLTIVIASYGFFAEDGGYERVQLESELTDAVTLTGGLVFYESGSAPGLSGVGDNDTAFVEIKYSF